MYWLKANWFTWFSSVVLKDTLSLSAVMREPQEHLKKTPKTKQILWNCQKIVWQNHLSSRSTSEPLLRVFNHIKRSSVSQSNLISRWSSQLYDLVFIVIVSYFFVQFHTCNSSFGQFDFYLKSCPYSTLCYFILTANITPQNVFLMLLKHSLAYFKAAFFICLKSQP